MNEKRRQIQSNFGERSGEKTTTDDLDPKLPSDARARPHTFANWSPGQESKTVKHRQVGLAEKRLVDEHSIANDALKYKNAGDGANKLSGFPLLPSRQEA